jgi:hypothetical protein
MPAELVAAVIGALISKGAEVAVDGGKSAIGALYRFLRQRLVRNKEARRALEVAIREPDNLEMRANLIDVIEAEAAVDQSFAIDLERYWRAASVEVSAEGGSVINQFHGSARKVIQARDIGGDVAF